MDGLREELMEGWMEAERDGGREEEINMRWRGMKVRKRWIGDGEGWR